MADKIDTSKRHFVMIDNYIYLHHVLDSKGNGTFIVLPSYPESVQDRLQTTFSQTNPLSRTAPIYSYINSGPRTIDVSLSLHRDMMTQVNYGVSNLPVDIGDDYVDTLIKQLQGVALPQYNSSSKLVNPPLISVRLGNEIFIKGVVTSGIAVTFKLPLLANDKYAQVDIAFTVAEVTPYDASSAMEQGYFRGLDRTLERRLTT